MSTQHGRMGRKRQFVKASRGTGAGKKARLEMQRARLRGQKYVSASKMAAARVLANASTAGFLGIEKKFLDCAIAETALNANTDLTGGEYDPIGTGCTGCLSCPAQGDTEQSRDGKRVVIDSLILKGYVKLEESSSIAAGEPSTVFVAVVLDTQSNGAQLASEDVFKSLGNIANLNVAVNKNLLSGSRFRILKSQLFDLTPIGPVAAGAMAYNARIRYIDWYIPFKGGLPVNLNAGTTANVANVIDNSLHVVAFSSLGGKIAYNSRIRFQG